MSKLDEILDNALWNDGYVKAQIKALVLELIQEAFDKNLSTKQLMELVEAL